MPTQRGCGMRQVARQVCLVVGMLLVMTFSATGGTATPTMASLRQVLQGKTLVIGFSSRPTVMDVVGVKTAELLKADFGVETSYRSLDAPALAAAVITGQIPVGEVSLGRIASMAIEGGNPLVFATNDVGNDFVIVGRKSITSVADMKGKVWGASSSSGITITIRDGLLRQANLSPDDLRIVVLGGSTAVVQALLAGRADVGLMHVDQAAQVIERSPDHHIISYTYKQFPLVNDVWFAQRSWVQQNREMALAVTVASIKAARWARDNKEEFVKASLAYVPDLTQKVAEFSWEQGTRVIKVWDPNGGLKLENCAATLRVSLETGAIKRAIDCSEFVTFEFQVQARQILGVR